MSVLLFVFIVFAFKGGSAFGKNNNASVYWELLTHPIELGKDLKLTCRTKYKLENTVQCPVREWFAGSENDLLLYNGYPNTEQKYEENVNLSSTNFTIVVKNCTLSDLNINYTCSCGFDSFTKLLQVTDNNFIYIPDNRDIEVSTNTTNDTKLIIDIIINQSFPKPRCYITIENRDVNIKSRFSVTEKRILYKSVFHSMFDIECYASPRIYCVFGTIQRNLSVNLPSVRCGGTSATDTLTVFRFERTTILTAVPVISKPFKAYGIIIIIVTVVSLVLMVTVILAIKNKISTILKGKRTARSRYSHKSNSCWYNQVDRDARGRTSILLH